MKIFWNYELFEQRGTEPCCKNLSLLVILDIEDHGKARKYFTRVCMFSFSFDAHILAYIYAFLSFFLYFFNELVTHSEFLGKRNESVRLVITAVTGIVFGLLIGASLPANTIQVWN